MVREKPTGYKEKDMKLFDDINEMVRDDLAKTIRKGSKVSIAAVCFYMYAYNELQKQLESVNLQEKLNLRLKQMKKELELY